MAAWPSGTRLVALVSGGGTGPHDRWTVLAPATEHRQFSVASDPDGAELLSAMRASSPPFAALSAADGSPLPFAGGWIGFVGYEFGQAFEPKSSRGTRQISPDDPTASWPDAVLVRVPRALLYSHERHEWYEVGDPTAASIAELIDPQVAVDSHARMPQPTAVHGVEPLLDSGHFTNAVARAIEFVRAGDIFQANISQGFRASLDGDARAWALASLERIAPRYGAYLEIDEHHSLVSFSPELFFSLDGQTRRALTRPMKGTRSSEAPESDLVGSEKDAAELHMIVDLMRNDFGRVCEIGSVKVDESRLLERHPTVLQTIAEVSGRVTRTLDATDLLKACFPPGSVTGAPKIRAMQIIEELERARRGPYCGAIGMMSGCGSAEFSVAIRTAMLTRQHDDRWNIDYRAGCGIVAESDPADELRECLAKTRVLELALDTHTTHATP